MLQLSVSESKILNKFANNFLIRQRTIVENYIFYIFLLQMDKKKSVFSFSSVLALKKIKEDIPPGARTKKV